MQYQRTVLFICAGLVLAAAHAGSPADPPPYTDDMVAVGMDRQRELAEIAELLRNPEVQGYVGAVHSLVHIASRYPQMPAEVRSLLMRVTSSPDRELADFAERALYAFEHRPEPEPGISEEVLHRRARRQDLERAQEALAGYGPDAGTARRLAAVNTLAHLLSTAPPDLAEEVMQVLEQVKGDWVGRRGSRRGHLPSDGRQRPRRLHHPAAKAGDLEDDLGFAAAALAEQALAAREDRPVDPAFAPAAAPARDTTARRDEDDYLAMLAVESAGIRLMALEMLIEQAQNDGLIGGEHSRVIAAFESLAEDPDPRVAGRARFALAGLDGDDNGWANVYVGEGVQDSAALTRQPPAAKTPGPQNVGEIDEHGVFVGAVEPQEAQ